MSRKTEAEVQAEITALKELLILMPDNKRHINVAIRVLDSRLSHDDIYDAYEGDDLFDDAHATQMWRDGHSGGDAMSVQWREML